MPDLQAFESTHNDPLTSVCSIIGLLDLDPVAHGEPRGSDGDL